MIDKLITFAKNWHTHNQDGHGFDHVFRVYKLAQSILSDYPMADQEIVLASALLHDTYDEKLVDDVPAAKQQVAAFLTSISFQEQTTVFDIIDNLSFSSQLEGTAKPLTLNGKIVQDADRLDAIGAFGIARTIQYGVSRKRELYDPEIHPQSYKTKAAYHAANTTTINHFYEKLFKISSTLHTAKAKQLAVPRDQIMHDFVKAIESEYRDVYGN